jgi:membrane-bound serine protease (ClpP class)
MSNRRLTTARLFLAIFTTTLEEIAIYAIWRWVLPGWDINLSVSALIGMMAAWGIFSVSLFVLTTNILRKQVPAGLPSMVGTRGKAASALSPEGMVKIKSELWAAKADTGRIASGDDIEVVGEDGLKLVVKPVGKTDTKR